MAAAALLSAHGPLGAQTFELGGSFGWYQPLRNFHLGPVSTTDLPQRSYQLRGVAWGAEARVPLRDRLSVEGAFATARSTVPGCACPGGFVLPPTGERVDVITIEGLYKLRGREPTEISIGLGPAMIQHGGEGYRRYGSPRSWGGAGSVEVARALTSHVQAAARALGTAYSFHLDYPPQNGPQLDLLMSLSLRWRLHTPPT